jgi:hypothetical protein
MKAENRLLEWFSMKSTSGDKVRDLILKMGD